MNRNERDRQTNKSETHVRFNLALLLFLKEAERTSNFGKHEYYSNELSAPLSIASTRPNIAQKKNSYLSGIPFNSIWPFLFAREPFRSRCEKAQKIDPHSDRAIYGVILLHQRAFPFRHRPSRTTLSLSLPSLFPC